MTVPCTQVASDDSCVGERLVKGSRGNARSASGHIARIDSSFKGSSWEVEQRSELPVGAG